MFTYDSHVAGVAQVQATIRAQQEGQLWNRFLAALSAGLPSVVEYEADVAATSAAEEEQEFDNDSEEAGDIYEGYDDFSEYD